MIKKLILYKKDFGFTLIELLVVVAIIGLLASVVMASLNTARAKARDTRRKEDLVQLRTALQLYANDNNGSYPSTGGVGVWWGNCSHFGSHPTSGATGWVPNLAPTYIPVLPLDPNPILPNDCYIYDSDGVDYKILAILTVETAISSSDSFKDPPPNSRSATYALYTSNASGW